MNKQLQTADKSGLPALVLDKGLTYPHHKK